MKTIVLDEIRARDCTRGGQRIAGCVATGHKAVIVPGVSIRLHGVSGVWGTSGAGKVESLHDRLFALGDTVEYDSYNLAYHGTIAAIGEKTITVVDNGKARRLSIYEFDRRNFDLDLETAYARNLETLAAI